LKLFDPLQLIARGRVVRLHLQRVLEVRDGLIVAALVRVDLGASHEELGSDEVVELNRSVVVGQRPIPLRQGDVLAASQVVDLGLIVDPMERET
jgi:hypothetical protein